MIKNLHDTEEEERKEINGSKSTPNAYLPRFSLFLLSFAFLCTFTSYNATQNVESSLIPGNLGTWSLASLYAAFCFGALFIAPFAVRYLGSKKGLVIGSITYAGFIAANINPLWPSMIVCAVVNGLGASILWASQGAYVTAAAVQYSKAKGQPVKASMAEFTGIFFMIMLFSQVIGNVISGVVLVKGASDSAVRLLFYIFLGLSGIGSLMLVFLRQMDLPDQDKEQDNMTFSERFWEIISVWKDKRVIFFIPVMFYSGLEQAFISADFTSELIEKEWVGFVMAAFGAADSLGSLAVAKLSERMGKMSLLYIGFITHATVLVFLLVFLRFYSADDVKDMKYVLFSTAAVYGIGDAAWQVFPNTMMSIFFTENTEAAFSIMKLFQSLGYVVGFIWQPLLPFWVKNVIVLAVVCVCLVSVSILNYIAPFSHTSSTMGYENINN